MYSKSRCVAEVLRFDAYGAYGNRPYRKFSGWEEWDVITQVPLGPLVKALLLYSTSRLVAKIIVFDRQGEPEVKKVFTGLEECRYLVMSEKRTAVFSTSRLTRQYTKI